MSSKISEGNKGKVLFYNKELNKFVKIRPDSEIPDGYVSALGKTIWIRDDNNKRKKVFIG